MLALAEGERHGYGIMQEVTTLSEGTLRLGPGTLYRTIKGLLVTGLVEESGDRPDPAMDDERRRYYRLTDAGRLAVQAEARRLEQLVETARRKHVLQPAEGSL